MISANTGEYSQHANSIVIQSTALVTGFNIYTISNVNSGLL